MLEVVSIKFKNRGKSYYFAPNSLNIKTGDKVIVETSKGLEIADCSYGNHMVEETSVVQGDERRAAPAPGGPGGHGGRSAH